MSTLHYMYVCCKSDSFTVEICSGIDNLYINAARLNIQKVSHVQHVQMCHVQHS